MSAPRRAHSAAPVDSVSAPRPTYLAVLRTEHVPGTFAAALLGRLSYGTVGLSLVLSLADATGSLAAAGIALAVFSLASVVLSPARAALIDRYGVRRALLPMAAVYALLLAALAAAILHHGVPALPLTVLTAAAGACSPPLGPVMRTLWRALIPDLALRRRAFSLDTVAEELIYVTGPLIAGVFVAYGVPAAGIAASAALTLGGTVALSFSPAVRAVGARTTAGRRAAAPGPAVSTPAPAPASGTAGAAAVVPDSAPAGRSAAGLARIWRPVLVVAGIGVGLGALELLFVAFAEARHDVAAAAWVSAALATGSVLGGLVHGALPARVSQAATMPRLATVLGVSLAAAGLAPNLPVLAWAAAVTGLFIAPLLATAYLIVDEAAGPGSRTRASAWVNTGFNAGDAAGTAGVGLLFGRVPLGLCFALAAVPVLAAALVVSGAARIERRRESAEAARRPRS